MTLLKFFLFLFLFNDGEEDVLHSLSFKKGKGKRVITLVPV